MSLLRLRFSKLLRARALWFGVVAIAIAPGCHEVLLESSTGSGSTGDNPCFPDSCTGPSTTSASGSTAAATTGAGGALVCGGFVGAGCPDDMFCDFPDDQCGGNDGQGLCTPRPIGCDKNLDPTCACDGKTYSNECDANAAGWDRSALGGCEPPMGAFECGAKFCLEGTYCERALSDVPEELTSFQCKPLPASCGPTPSCACLANEPCGALCSADPNGFLTATCPGG